MILLIILSIIHNTKKKLQINDNKSSYSIPLFVITFDD